MHILDSEETITCICQNIQYVCVDFNVDNDQTDRKNDVLGHVKMDTFTRDLNAVIKEVQQAELLMVYYWCCA